MLLVLVLVRRRLNRLIRLERVLLYHASSVGISLFAFLAEQKKESGLGNTSTVCGGARWFLYFYLIFSSEGGYSLLMLLM